MIIAEVFFLLNTVKGIKFGIGNANCKTDIVKNLNTKIENRTEKMEGLKKKKRPLKVSLDTEQSPLADLFTSLFQNSGYLLCVKYI